MAELLQSFELLINFILNYQLSSNLQKLRHLYLRKHHRLSILLAFPPHRSTKLVDPVHLIPLPEIFHFDLLNVVSGDFFQFLKPVLLFESEYATGAVIT